MSEKKNEVAVAKQQQIQNIMANQVETSCSNMGCELTKYGKQCVVSAIEGALSLLSTKSIEDKQTGQKREMTINDIDVGQFRLSLQSIGFLELNYGSMPSEIYFDLRGDSLTIKTQGAGNEKLVRKYGVGIAENGLHSAWVIREGDEFTLPSYDGLKITPPTWKRKSISGKALFVVYPLVKSDGSTEWLIADREGVKQNIVAHIRQNTLYTFKQGYKVDVEARNKFYEQLNVDAEKLSLDELIANEKYKQYINPTYTSYGSKEPMIIRKMMNNALKNYPKEFNGYQKDAVQKLYEDVDESLNQPRNVQEANIIEQVNKEIEEKPNDEKAAQDFKVNEDGEVIKEEVKTNTEVKPEEKPVENKEEPVEEKEVDPYANMFH